MQRHIQHVGALVENVLGAIAVMKIHVEDGDARGSLVAQVLRGDGGVIQEAVAAVQIPGRMMPGRAAQSERSARAPVQVDGAVTATSAAARAASQDPALIEVSPAIA